MRITSSIGQPLSKQQATEGKQAAGMGSSPATQKGVGVPDALQGLPVSAPGQEGRQEGMRLAALRV